MPFQEPPSHNTAATSTTCCWWWDMSGDSGADAQGRQNWSATECKSWRTGVQTGTCIFFWQRFSGEPCPHDHTLFYEEPHRCLPLITRSGNFQKRKAAGLECSLSSQRHIYPLYSPTLTPVIPVNIRHLSLTHTGTRAVPHQFPPWVNHPTSHLCFQTHAHPVTHILQKPPVSHGAQIG